MKSGDPEYQHLFQIFREECKEHIHNLNEGLLALERQPKEASLEGILRSAHSLKGAARMMGIKTLETLAHYLESVLTQLDRGEKEVSPPIMESLYRNVDAISKTLSSLEKIPAEGAAASDAKQEAQPPHAAPKDEGAALTTVRVQTDKLDTLINLVGELLVSKIEALEDLRHLEETLGLLEEWRKQPETKQATFRNRIEALNDELYGIIQGLSENTHRLERLVDEIHAGVRDLRLLPLSTILDPFPRMVRDLSRDLGKEVELLLEGTSTRLDKKILEEIREPLIHLVRNSIDHGVEPPEERIEQGKARQGRIVISARQEGGRVLISVKDDGRGLDRQTIERVAVEKGIVSAEEIGRWLDEDVWDLVFRSGFSTAQTVTEVSGRGVGLNAVVAKVEGLKGFLRVESKAGEGTAFKLSLPLTLSTTHVLLFLAGGEIFCLPTDVLESTLVLSLDQITSIEGKGTVVINGLPLAFIQLADLLRLPHEDGKKGTIPALLLQTPRGRVVLGVDALLGEEEIVAKGLGKLLSRVPHLSGGTILSKGQIALILDPNDLVRSLARQAASRSISASPTPAGEPALALNKRRKKKVLVAEDSLTTRTLEKNILEAAGFDVTTAVDGEDALVKLHEKSFDIVISDVQMPRMDGLALTEKIKRDERFKEIPVILITGLETEADKRRGVEVGADAYITKASFDQKHLLEVLQRLV